MQLTDESTEEETPINRLPGERSFFVLVVCALVVALLTWVTLRPSWPSLPTNEYTEVSDAQYGPGSPKCYPSRLNSLTESEAADEAYRCQVQAAREQAEGKQLVEQSRAADAAVALVDLTYRQTLVALAGILFGLITLLAAVYAAWYARKAAEAGFASNAIAADTAKRQLRAYVGVEFCSIEDLPDEVGFVVTANLVNSGQTPAYDLRLMGESFADDYPLSIDREFAQPLDIYGATLAPNKTLCCSYRLLTDDYHGTLRRISAGEIGLYIQGFCEYSDAFDQRHRTTFRFVHGGRLAQFGERTMHADQRGNDAD